MTQPGAVARHRGAGLRKGTRLGSAAAQAIQFHLIGKVDQFDHTRHRFKPNVGFGGICGRFSDAAQNHDKAVGPHRAPALQCGRATPE